MTDYINLQNTPDPENIHVEAVAFQSNGVELKGNIYKPSRVSDPLPAVIVTGAWTTVKE